MVMEFAGVDYAEKNWDSSSSIDGVDYSICGAMILAEKGPINTPVLCKDIEQVKEIFGSYMKDTYGMYSIEGFFKNGGGDLYVSRLAHYADIEDANSCTMKLASASVKDKTGKEDTLTFKDKYLGSLGNKHGFKIIDEPSVKTSIIGEVNTDATEIIVKVSRDFVIGDYIKIADDSSTGNEEYAKIANINNTERKLILESPIKKSYSDGSEVAKADFTVEVYYKNVLGDQLEKTFNGVNMDPDSDRYVVAVINNSASGDGLLVVEDEYIDVEYPYEKLPKATESIVYLTGGDDGLDDFCEKDIIGSSASKTGYYAFDSIDDMIHVYCPESSSKEVIRAGFDYWENRMTGMFFAYCPSGLTPQQAADFRDEAGWNTSYGALYYNWGYVNDPIGVGASPEKLIPLTGHVLGAMCKNDKTNVNEYGSAPAGEKCVLKGVNSLEFNVDKTNGGILYGNKNRGINPIVSLRGAGICIWGSRTQSNDKKWNQIQYRRIFIYTELSVVNGSRWAAFENKDDALYRKMNRVVPKFLRSVKGLVGGTDAERFEFVCSPEINSEDDPYVISRVGLKLTGVAEFIYFEFGQKPEGISLSEI